MYVKCPSPKHGVSISMMFKLHPVYILVLHVLVVVLSQNTETVLKINDGEIRGIVERYFDIQISMYRGIPYAKPPVDNFRLEEPEKPDSWPTTLDATKFGSKCPQMDLQGNPVGKEDCLFINVFTPRTPTNQIETGYPVMVFIHGDDFQTGSVELYGPGPLVAEYKVVLVTFNYRLGLLGFLSTGDGACPGNLGLKDQLMALQWVRDNIHLFGGDKNSVTVFGQGAGAASVLLHILSPKSQGLFHRAITQSGSPLCDWAVQERPYDYAEEVSRTLGCSTKSTKAMVDCIRSKKLEEVLKAQWEDVTRINKTFGGYPVRTLPVVDRNGFLPDTPENLLIAGDFTPVPLMSGINKDDGALFYTAITSRQDELKKNSSCLQKEIIPLFLRTATDIQKNVESVSEALYFYYFNRIDSTNLTQVLQPFINMTTDAMFVSCNYKTLELYSAKETAKVYMYVFEYEGSSSMLDLELGRRSDYKGVSHGDELLYIFDVNIPYGTPSARDGAVKRELRQMWVEFAKKGESPVPEILKESYTSEFKHYLKIGERSAAETSFRLREVDLWLDHLPKLSGIKPQKDMTVEYQTGGLGWSMMVIAIILMVVVVGLIVVLKRKSKSQYFETNKEDK